MQEKAILSKPKEARTEEEKQILNKVIGGLKCFRRYPPVSYKNEMYPLNDTRQIFPSSQFYS